MHLSFMGLAHRHQLPTGNVSPCAPADPARVAVVSTVAAGRDEIKTAFVKALLLQSVSRPARIHVDSFVSQSDNISWSSAGLFDLQARPACQGDVSQSCGTPHHRTLPALKCLWVQKLI